MYGSLEISASGMVAQRMRLDTISQNIAQASTLRDEKGQLNPYRRRAALFAPGNPNAQTAHGRKFGVHVAQIAIDKTPAQPSEFNPNSPDAYTTGPYKGYVAKTNISTVVENVNAMEAVRAYEANVMAAEATKQITASALRLIA